MYGFSSDVLAIVIQRLTGVDIETYWYVQTLAPVSVLITMR